MAPILKRKERRNNSCTYCLPYSYPTTPASYVLSVLFVSRSLKSLAPSSSLLPILSSSRMLFTVSEGLFSKVQRPFPGIPGPALPLHSSHILPSTAWVIPTETRVVSHTHCSSHMLPQIGTLPASNVCLLKFYPC